jgi:hypothetical protein
MQSILGDLRFAWKLLLRDRAFSLTVLSTLAVCIGANVAIYGVVHSVVLRPLPFHEPERLVVMYNLYPGFGVGREQAEDVDHGARFPASRRGKKRGLGPISAR